MTYISMPTELKKYPLMFRGIHWITALLVIALFSLGLWMRSLDYYHSWYQSGPALHVSLGIVLLVILTIRVIYRQFLNMNNNSSSHSPWEQRLAKGVHLVIYLFMGTLILTGLLEAGADGVGVPVFDLLTLPSIPISFENQDELVGTIHEWVAYSLVGVSILHGVAAMKHQFLDRDNTLKKML